MSIFSKVWQKVTGKEEQEQQGASDMPQFIPTPSSEVPRFSDAHIQLIERNHQVDSKEDMLNYVEDANLSFECKQTFKNIICNLYDRNIIMANNWRTNGVEIAQIETLITIFPNILAASTKNDRMQPEWLETYEMIKYQLRTRLTRTDGKDRERTISMKTPISSEISMNRGNQEVKK